MTVAALYPITVLACIVITANHFLLDAMCGAALLGVAHTLAAWAPELGRGTAHGRRPCPDGESCSADDPDCEALQPRQYSASSAACEKRLIRGGSCAAFTERTKERAGLDGICVQD